MFQVGGMHDLPITSTPNEMATAHWICTRVGNRVNQEAVRDMGLEFFYWDARHYFPDTEGKVVLRLSLHKIPAHTESINRDNYTQSNVGKIRQGEHSTNT